MSFKQISFLGLPLSVAGDADDVCRLMRKQKNARLVTCVGPDAWKLARRSPQFAADLDRMSLVLPDGMGLALAARILGGENCEPIGFDRLSFTSRFFAAAIEGEFSLALIGGRPGVDEDVHGKLGMRYPELNIVYTVHGFGDFAPKIAALVKKAPDIVIVDMGAPRQEAFLVALRDAGYDGFAIAYDDFLDGFEHFPSVLAADPCPGWIDQFNLRSFYRLYKEPRRLWRRYVVDYPLFFAQALFVMIGPLIEKGRAATRRL